MSQPALSASGKWVVTELVRKLEDGWTGELRIKIGEGGVQWIKEEATKKPPKRSS